jgi:hypothetical protein
MNSFFSFSARTIVSFFAVNSGKEYVAAFLSYEFFPVKMMLFSQHVRETERLFDLCAAVKSIITTN